MDAHQTRSYDRLARVREFGRKNPTAFPADSDAGALLARLDTLVETLAGHSVTKTTGIGLAREGSANRRTARAALRDDLEAVGRTARAIALRIPNVEQKFRLPAVGRDQALLDAARAFAAEASSLEQEFARLALGPEFFAKLQADIAAFERALASQQGGRQTRVAAAGAIDDALAEGARIVRQLDAFVLNRFVGEPLTLAAWRDTSRTRRSGRRRSKDPSEEPPAKHRTGAQLPAIDAIAEEPTGDGGTRL